MAKNESYAVVEKGPTFGVRHLQCFLLFWYFTFACIMCVNFSLAIVAMTDNKSANLDFEEYKWTEYEKSLLLSGFFWGNVIAQIPAGHFAQKFGGKITLGTGLFFSSIIAILTPMSARIGSWKFIFVLRVLQGMSQSVTYPSINTLIAKWAHKDERASFATYAFSGSQVGTVVMYMSGGFIASSSLGWPGIFYISGLAGLIWTICWYIWGASSPNDSKIITNTEKSYIEMSILNESQKSKNDISKFRMSPPWVKFMTSLPFLAVLIAQTCSFWSYWTLITQIPTYMKNILGFNIKSNALLSSLPYFGMLLSSFVFSVLASLINKHQWLSLTGSRKFFNTIALWIPAAALAFLGYVDASQTVLGIVLLVISVSSSAGGYLSFMVNYIDLSPNFAGTLASVSYMLANLMGILAPLTVGFIVSDEKNPMQWRIVFCLASIICFFGNLVFLIFGSAEVQPWNQPEQILVSTEEPKEEKR